MDARVHVHQEEPLPAGTLRGCFCMAHWSKNMGRIDHFRVATIFNIPALQLGGMSSDIPCGHPRESICGRAPGKEQQWGKKLTMMSACCLVGRM